MKLIKKINIGTQRTRIKKTHTLEATHSIEVFTNEEVSQVVVVKTNVIVYPSAGR